MRRMLAVVIVGAAVAACADSGDPTSEAPPLTLAPAAPLPYAPPTTAGTTTTTTDFSDPLPPHTSEALSELFEPIVRDLGFTVTRASLVDLTSYQASPEGRHLAVYVAPIDPMTPDEHAGAFLPLAAAFLPDVFQRWSGLESFDICQEPHAWPGTGTPPAVTLIDVDRATSQAIDWSTVTLGDLIAMAHGNDALRVTASPDIAESSVWSGASG